MKEILKLETIFPWISKRNEEESRVLTPTNLDHQIIFSLELEKKISTCILRPNLASEIFCSIGEMEEGEIVEETRDLSDSNHCYSNENGFREHRKPISRDGQKDEVYVT